MKTILDIDDELLARARRHAANTGQSLEDVIEDGLRRVLSSVPRSPSRERIRVSPEGFAHVAEMVRQPPAPTPELRDLMSSAGERFPPVERTLEAESDFMQCFRAPATPPVEEPYRLPDLSCGDPRADDPLARYSWDDLSKMIYDDER
jgi:uncharacterized protein (DUF1778 family)